MNSLHEITRYMAIAYSRYLTEQVKANVYGRTYIHDLYQIVRRFFLFALDEQVDEHLSHNPFTLKDISSKEAYLVPRYLSDQEIKAVLAYCERDATLLEKVVVTLLLHTGIRIAELAMLKASDVVQIGGTWKLHIHEGKGLKDRVIPLTVRCVELLQAWQNSGWERVNDFLFTHYGRPRQHGTQMSALLRKVGLKAGVVGLTAHRFRHTFAVALLNYGIRETALQKLMGHATLGMTLEYARILDHTVEQSFTEAVSHMQEDSLSWVPGFFLQEDYTLFVEGDAVSWIRLPLGYCRRNAKLHCESVVKCLLCDRFAIGKEDLPRLKLMYDRFLKLGLQVKADVVASQIQRLELSSGEGHQGFIPVQAISLTKNRSEKGHV